MITRISTVLLFCILISLVACEKRGDVKVNATTTNTTGLKVAYINSDSILLNYGEFRKESTAFEQKKKNAEDELLKKGAALEREFMNYQQQAQKGTMTGKEMEAREKYLTSRQQSLMAEQEQISKAFMEETAAINKRLHDAVHGILNDIKDKEGYDFILSYIAGGPILVADEKYDITEQVLTRLNDGTTDGDADIDTTEAN